MSREINTDDAKKWSDEEFKDNATYLMARGGDVEGTEANDQLKAIVEARGEDLEKVMAQNFGDEPEAPEDPDNPPADEFEPGPATTKKGAK